MADAVQDKQSEGRSPAALAVSCASAAVEMEANVSKEPDEDRFARRWRRRTVVLATTALYSAVLAGGAIVGLRLHHVSADWSPMNRITHLASIVLTAAIAAVLGLLSTVVLDRRQRATSTHARMR
jgi:uncharacterized membrane protein YcjF (UPF0283 family)